MKNRSHKNSAVASIYWLLPLLFLSLPLMASSPSLALPNRIHNCEVEIDMLKKNIESQEEARSALERDVLKLMKATKESSRESAQSVVDKNLAIEKQVEKLVIDLKEMKRFSQDLHKTFSSVEKSITTLEERLQTQAQSIQSLEKAMRALTQAFKGSSTSENSSTHIVQSGESLEKIAKKYNTTVRAIKDLNNLSSNMIRQGQELQIAP